MIDDIVEDVVVIARRTAVLVIRDPYGVTRRAVMHCESADALRDQFVCGLLRRASSAVEANTRAALRQIEGKP